MNKNTETPNITTKINSKADFTFGKDDILLILIEKKEQELLATLEALKIEVEEVKNLKQLSFENFNKTVYSLIKKSLDLEEYEIKNLKFNRCIYLSSYETDAILKSADIVSIDKVNQSSNIKLAIRRNSYTKTVYKENIDFNTSVTFNICFNKQIFGEEKQFSIEHKIKLDGLESNKLEKKFLTKFKHLFQLYIDNNNELSAQLLDLEKQINDVEVELLLLDSDKTVKANLYKQILTQNPELKKLIS